MLRKFGDAMKDLLHLELWCLAVMALGMLMQSFMSRSLGVAQSIGLVESFITVDLDGFLTLGLCLGGAVYLGYFYVNGARHRKKDNFIWGLAVFLAAVLLYTLLRATVGLAAEMRILWSSTFDLTWLLPMTFTMFLAFHGGVAVAMDT
jgi:hypothetical protein